MGFDNDCILNIQSLAGEYFCPVCHLLVYPSEALQAQCTHLYCKPCLTYVVSSTHACPYDGYRVTEADCKPLLESNKALADTIGNIQVHCLYYRTGCTWQGTFSDCISHCSTCSFGESPVLCNRCGVQIVHRQVQEHAQNCPGVQPQGQQSGKALDNTSTGMVAAADQSHTAAQTGLSASQAQTGFSASQAQTGLSTSQALTGLSASQAQTSQASAPLLSGLDNPAASSAGQPQAAMPAAEQWYQQQQQYQQQYQQYYQQYPGYDPYQQNYQYYYQYQQGAQQYLQQPMQGYPPQAHGHAQTQPQLQVQQQVQPQQQPQAPPRTVQPPLQTNAQPAANVQSQVQSVGQAQPQMQAQGQAPPYNQSQPLAQAQPYAQSQPSTQQQTLVPQYQQTHPHAQSYPPSQTQTQQYPYTHPQPHAQAQSQTQTLPQPQSQPVMQTPARPPSQQNQPVNPNAQLQPQNSVTGYQSYPQPQPHPQAQAGVGHPMHGSGLQPQPHFPGQMMGKFPLQPSQMYPPQPYSNVATPQQPTMSSAQGQPPSGPVAQQLPVYPHSQQPGYPFPHRPGVPAVHQAAPQQYGQQQSFPGHGSFTQPHPPMTAQLHAQGPPQTLQQSQQNYAPGYGTQPIVAQNYAARPGAAQGAGSQPFVQAAGPSGAGQVRTSQKNHFSAASEHQAGHSLLSSRAIGGEKSLDLSIPKESGPVSENTLDGNRNENKLPGSKLLESDVQEGKQRIKGDASEGVSEPSHGNNTAKSSAEDLKDARKKAEVQDLKDNGSAAATASNFPHSHLGPQVHSTNSFPTIDQGRNKLQPMQYGSSAQHRPGNASMSQSTPQLLNSQQPGLGHPPGQLRPQGPGQVPPRPPFNAADNFQASIPKHPHGPISHENASGGNLGPGSTGPFAKPGNMGYYQDNMPPYQAGQPQNPPGETFVAAQRSGPHFGVGGREHADAEHRPPYPMENGRLQAHRSGNLDGRMPESFSHGSMDKVSYGPAQPGDMKFGGPLSHDSMSFPGIRDGRANPFPHRDLEDDLRKFPRPSPFEAGPSSKHGPSSLEHGPHMFSGDGMPGHFDKGPHGFDHDSRVKMDSGVGSGPSRFLPPFQPNDTGERSRAAGFPDDNLGRGDFGHHPDFPKSAPGSGFGRPRMDGLPPRSPGRDFSGFPSCIFGAYGDGENQSRPFEGSRPYNFPAEPFGKLIQENRFPVPPNHLQRGEHDVPRNLRMGEHLVGGPRDQDLLPTHLRREHMGPRNLHMREETGFGPSGGHPRMGESPLAGNLPHHLPFGEFFGGEKPGHPLVREHGYRGSSGFQHHAREDRFYPDEVEPFDNPRMRKPGSVMCRICKVECGTLEGLDLHSQSREHQRKARDMVLSIKQSNKKKQKISKDQASLEGRNGGRPKNSSFQGRGIKR